MNEKIRWLGVTILLVVLLISSVSVLSNGIAPTAFFSLNSFISKVTGGVVGLPDCRIAFDFSVPKTVGVFPNTPHEIEIGISNVKCGLTHAVLTLETVHSGYFMVEPAYYPALYPGKEQSYTVTLDIPDTEAGTILITRAVVMDNSQKYYSPEFEIHIAETLEKPAAPIGRSIESIVVSEAEPAKLLSTRSWWSLGFVAVVAAIFLVIYEYVPHKGKKSERRKL
jgi:hypothetical protein